MSTPARELPQLAVACPTCHAVPGALCTSHGGTRQRRHDTHQARRSAWAEAETANIGTDLNRVHLTPPPERTYAETIESPTIDAQLDETQPAQGQYRVTYERVGRRRDIPPLTVVAAGADDLAERIYDDVRKYLLSRWPEVHVDLEEMRGFILCGFNSGGQFAIERLDGAVVAAEAEQERAR